MVYGVSGTGKSSLIQCGLANKFQESDWLPISIRRGGNINESLTNAIQKAGDSFSEEAPKGLKKLLRNLYLDNFKPIYLIFDQFEELFIFGSKPEKEDFVKSIKKLVESDLQIKMLFVIREEYLANITEFEKEIPEFLQNRIRIEKMNRSNAKQAIEGPCKVAGIEVEDGFAEALLDKLTTNNAEIELTYLQVFLDKIYRTATNKTTTNIVSFNHYIIESLGGVKDLLGSFLEEQIAELEHPDEGLIILKAFVSTKGTKRQITQAEVLDYSRTLGKDIPQATLTVLLQKFVSLRILRDKDENGRYELRHDALASKIYEKITLVEKELLEIRQFIENAYDNYQRRNILLSKDDLQYIAPYEDKIFLGRALDDFVAKSKREIEKARRRKFAVVTTAAVILISIFAGFTWWALNEKTKATEMAKVAKIKEQQANIAKQKALAEKFNFVAKELTKTNPTKALRIAEYAYSLDTTNNKIYQNILDIYYNIH